MVLEKDTFVEIADAPFNPSKISSDKYLNLFIIDEYGKLHNRIDGFWNEVAGDFFDVASDSFDISGTELSYKLWSLNSYG
jgi:hypothetical protein